MGELATEITMELLTDVARALQSVARDFLPASSFTVSIQRTPPAVVLRVAGATTKPLETALAELARSVQAVTEKTIPSLVLRYTVIGGSEAAGIEIVAVDVGRAVYGNIIKATIAWLRPSAHSRRQRPNLPGRILL